MNSVYPVNSFYFTTASTCPLQALGIGTWQKVGSSIITSVNTEVPVKGNGKMVGVIDGQDNILKGWNGSSNAQYNLRPYGTGNLNDGYNDGLSTASGGYPIGITTDADSSGIVGTVTRTSLTVNIFKRTA